MQEESDSQPPYTSTPLCLIVPDSQPESQSSDIEAGKIHDADSSKDITNSLRDAELMHQTVLENMELSKLARTSSEGSSGSGRGYMSSSEPSSVYVRSRDTSFSSMNTSDGRSGSSGIQVAKAGSSSSSIYPFSSSHSSDFTSPTISSPDEDRKEYSFLTSRETGKSSTAVVETPLVSSNKSQRHVTFDNKEDKESSVQPQEYKKSSDPVLIKKAQVVQSGDLGLSAILAHSEENPEIVVSVEEKFSSGGKLLTSQRTQHGKAGIKKSKHMSRNYISSSEHSSEEASMVRCHSDDFIISGLCNRIHSTPTSDVIIPSIHSVSTISIKLSQDDSATSQRESTDEFECLQLSRTGSLQDKGEDGAEASHQSPSMHLLSGLPSLQDTPSEPFQTSQVSRSVQGKPEEKFEEEVNSDLEYHIPVQDYLQKMEEEKNMVTLPNWVVIETKDTQDGQTASDKMQSEDQYHNSSVASEEKTDEEFTALRIKEYSDNGLLSSETDPKIMPSPTHGTGKTTLQPSQDLFNPVLSGTSESLRETEDLTVPMSQNLQSSAGTGSQYLSSQVGSQYPSLGFNLYLSQSQTMDDSSKTKITGSQDCSPLAKQGGSKDSIDKEAATDTDQTQPFTDVLKEKPANEMGQDPPLASAGNQDGSAVQIKSSEDFLNTAPYLVQTSFNLLDKMHRYEWAQVILRREDSTVLRSFTWIETKPEDEEMPPRLQEQEFSLEDLLDSDGELTHNPVKIAESRPPRDELTSQPTKRKRSHDEEQTPGRGPRHEAVPFLAKLSSPQAHMFWKMERRILLPWDCCYSIVKFDDGDVHDVNNNCLIESDSLPVGQELLVTDDRKLYREGVVAGICRISAKHTGYLVCLAENNEVRRFSRSHITLTATQGNALRNTLQLSKGNKEEHVQSHRSTRSPHTSVTKGKKKKLRPRRSTPSRPRSRQADSSTSPEIQRAVRKRLASRYCQSSLSSSPPGSESDIAIPRNRELFRGFAFVVTKGDKKKQQEIKTDSQQSESSGAEDTTGVIKFHRKVIKGLLREGGGIVFDEMPTLENRCGDSCVLIADRYQTTEKYLFALATGMLCVSYTWVVFSCRDNEVKDINKYILPAGKDLVSGKIVEMCHKERPLREKKVYVYDPSSHLSKWHLILEAAGADVVKRLPPNVNRMLESDSQLPYICDVIVIAVKKEPLSLRRKAELLNIPMVSEKWLVQCLIRNTFVDPVAHNELKHFPDH